MVYMNMYVTVLCLQAIPILSASLLCQPYIPLLGIFHLLVSSLFVVSNESGVHSVVYIHAKKPNSILYAFVCMKFSVL